MLLTNNKFYVALLAITMLFAPMASGQELDEIEDLDIPAEEEQVDIDDIIDRAQNRHTITNLFDETHLNTRDAGLFGTWSVPARWPIVAIHAALLPNGEVLTYGTNEFADNGSGFVYDRWDPESGLTPLSHDTLDVQTSNNLFCSAQALVPGTGGLMLVTGGSVERNGRRNFGLKSVNVFDPVDNSFYMPLDDMFRARWYPTVTQLADGRLLILGGRDDRRRPTVVPEIFDPAAGQFKLMTGGRSTAAYKNSGWNYPRSFMAPNGKVLIMPVAQTNMYYMAINGRGSIKNAGTLPVSAKASHLMSVMYEPGKILSIRRRDARILTLDDQNDDIEVTNAGNIASQRFWADSTLLPNGEVLVSGGSEVNQSLDDAVRPVEIWNPTTNSWRMGAPARKSRLYHSTSLLLPNGTVLCAGGGPPGPAANLNAEVYYPHYLFEPDGSWRQRPRLLGEVGGRGSVMRIRAKGAEGFERFRIRVNGRHVRTIQVTQKFQTYTYVTDTPVTGSQVELFFFNDQFDAEQGIDTTLTIDYMELDGVRHQTEDPRVFSMEAGEPGFIQSQKLFNNGYFQYFDQEMGYVQLGIVPHGSTLDMLVDRVDTVEEARLIRFGSVTHSFDMGQRGVTLDVEQNDDVVSIRIPSTRKKVPPGYYMLFILDDRGTPSRAAILELQ
jgi:hypothetical protein